jgi:hypothetical protein
MRPPPVLLRWRAVSELAPTRVLRRALEQSIETRLASAILFEALGAGQQSIPHTAAEVLSVVRGPLREVLARRMGGEAAGELVAGIERELLAVHDDPVTLETPLDDLVAETRRGEETTAAFPVAERAVPVLVVASGRGFEQRLALSLGELRAAPVTVRSHEALQRALDEATPPIFLIDAADFPAIDPDRLLAAADGLPPTSVCVLWGAELPYGRNLQKSLAQRPRSWVTLELRGGIEPLLDLVRSRRRSRRA